MTKVKQWQVHILFCLLIILSGLIGAACARRQVIKAGGSLMATPEPEVTVAPVTVATAPQEDPLEAMAEEVAKVLYGYRFNSDDDLYCVAWVIINRSESALYSDDIIEVCQQPQQWMGYSENNPVVENLYELAYKALDVWQLDGRRPFSADYLYFTWSSDEIVFRTKFEETKSCNYWRN